jgi:glyoxylase-like metal-dependent hydrolase (beta-lactamase superfamily II)
MLERDVAPGIHRIEHSFTNLYLVEDGDALTLVDAGVPSTWDVLHDALRELGRRPDQIRALVLTHAHFDHIGCAERARRELRIPVHVHGKDVRLTREPRYYAKERSPVVYALTHPQAAPFVVAFLKNRAWWPAPVEEVESYGDDAGELDVPGRPRVVPTPGHTEGHCALHFPDRDAVIAGDAIVTVNPYTAGRGPQIVARCANVNSWQALASLDAIAATGARTVLVGHGEPFREGAAEAAALARAAGIP